MSEEHLNQTSQHELHEDHDHYFLPFVLIFTFAVVEAVGSWYTGSLALLSDAGHMFSDVLALGLAWLASRISKQPNIARHHSGVSYAELGVSIFNAMTMLAVIVFVIIEAFERFQHPQPVQGVGLMLIATLGLIVNIIVAKQLHHQAEHHTETLNSRAAFLHVLGDLLGSLAAVLAGVVIYFTGWLPIDPLLSLVISVLLLIFTLNLIRDIVKTLQGHASLGGHEH